MPDLLSIVLSDDPLSMDAVEVLGRLGPDATGALIETIKKHANVETPVALGKLATVSRRSRPRQARTEAIRPLAVASRLRSFRPFSRGGSIDTSGYQRPVYTREAAEVFVAALTSDSNPKVREAAAHVYQATEPVSCPEVHALVRGMLHDPDAEVRRACAMRLQAVKPFQCDAVSALVPDLIKALEDSDVEIRKAAVMTLGNIGPAAKAAEPAVLKAVDSPPGSQNPSAFRPDLRHLAAAAAPDRHRRDGPGRTFTRVPGRDGGDLIRRAASAD